MALESVSIEILFRMRPLSDTDEGSPMSLARRWLPWPRLGKSDKALLPPDCHDCWRGRILPIVANNVLTGRRLAELK